MGVKCPDLNAPKNASIEYRPIGRGYKGTATVKCQKGYRYTKAESVTRTCQRDNRWSLDFDGECELVHCLSEPIVGHGRTSLSLNNTYGVNVTVWCDFGYTIEGEGVITCQANGMWSNGNGKCELQKQRFLFLLVLMLPVGAGIAYMTWRLRRHKRGSSHHDREENVPLAGQKRARVLTHCSFTLDEKFDAGNSVSTSPSYTIFASAICEQVKDLIYDKLQKRAEVHVVCINQQKKMVFVDIKCEDALTEDEIITALSSTRNLNDSASYHVQPGKIAFKDTITSALSTTMITQKHVKDIDMDITIDLDTQYVRLKMLSHKNRPISRDLLELPDRYQAQLDTEDAVDITDEDLVMPGETKKSIIIRGRAGIGKTTLIQRLMWRWAHGEWSKQLKAIFLLNFRVLVAINSKLDLPHLLSQCGVYRMVLPGLDAKWLGDNENEIGLFLDGLDEIPDFEKHWNEKPKRLNVNDKAKPLQWAVSLMKRDCLPECTLITTSRPFPALSSLRPAMLVEVMGLTRDRVMEFVKKNVQPARINMVQQTLLHRPILLSVSAITFYCAALCKVLQEDVGVTDKLCTYTQITAYVMEMYMCRSCKDPNSSEVLKNMSSSLRLLCQLAYDGLVTHNESGLAKLTFNKNDFENRGLKQQDLDGAQRAGLFLLTRVQDSKLVLGEFVHLSIQEFLAMAEVLLQSPAEARDRLRLMFSSGQFNMALLFLYGFGFNTSSDVIKKVHLAIGERQEPSEEMRSLLQEMIHTVPDNLQALQMVHESQFPELAREVGKKRFKKEVKISSTKLTVVDILAIAYLLKHHSSAKTISLKEVGLDAISTKELARFLKGNITVSTVELLDDGLDDECVKFLAEALESNNGVQRLSVQSNSVKDLSLKSLASALRSNESLSYLRIESSQLTDEGVDAIASALETNIILTDLRIFSRRITGRGVNSLAKALQNSTTVGSLVLEWTELDDNSAQDILQTLEINKTVHISIASPSCNPETRRQLKSHSRITMPSI